MRTLVIINDEAEGPGALEDMMLERGDRVHMARLYEGDSLPDYIEYFDSIVVLDGEMDANDEEAWPFLSEETEYLERAMEIEIPVLGFSLGAQLLAKACGASVKRAPEKETGLSEVSLTYMGLKDPLFDGVPLVLPVLEWHEDTFEIPPGGMLLATSHTCPNQAFRLRRAYGLQFLVEVDSDMLTDWFDDSGKLEEIVRAYRKRERDFAFLAERIYKNFLALTS